MIVFCRCAGIVGVWLHGLLLLVGTGVAPGMAFPASSSSSFSFSYSTPMRPFASEGLVKCRKPNPEIRRKSEIGEEAIRKNEDGWRIAGADFGQPAASASPCHSPPAPRPCPHQSAIRNSKSAIQHSAHSDEQGHIVALTDAAGAVTDQFAYGPYGENWGRLGTTYLPFQWLGDHGVWTLPNGLCLTQHRVYDKTLRRFTSSDPAGLAGGNNLYAYTDGNPINEIDPSGLCAEVGGRTYSVQVTPLRDAKMDAHLQDVLLRQKLARDNPDFYHFKYGYDASDAAQLVANIIFTAISMVTPFPDELLAAPAMARTGRALGATGRFEKITYGVTQSRFLEYKTLRAQGYTASKAHGLMKQFDAGVNPNGSFLFHFASESKASFSLAHGIPRTDYGFGVWRGVYTGTTPTPSWFIKNTTPLGWGLTSQQSVRMPIVVRSDMNIAKPLFRFPLKTRIIRTNGNLPLSP